MKKTKKLLGLLLAPFMAAGLAIAMTAPGALSADAAAVVSGTAADQLITYESASAGTNFSSSGTNAQVKADGIYTKNFQETDLIGNDENAQLQAANGDWTDFTATNSPVLGGNSDYRNFIFRTKLTPQIANDGWGYMRLYFRVWDHAGWGGVSLDIRIGVGHMDQQQISFRKAAADGNYDNAEIIASADLNDSLLPIDKSDGWKFDPTEIELTLVAKETNGTVYIDGEEVLTTNALPENSLTGRFEVYCYKSAMKFGFPTYITTNVPDEALTTCPEVIAYETNGGSAVPFSAVTSGTIETAPVSTKTGYALEGWYSDSALENKITFPYTVTEDAVLYANWEAKHTATFKADGTTVDTVEFTASDSSITEPTVPAKTGYNGAWETYELNGEDIEINAVYTPIDYTITYAGTEGAENTNPTSYNVETQTITLSNLEREDYVFVGWYNGEVKVTQIAQGSTGDLTLTAKWREASSNTYTVTFSGTTLEAATVEQGDKVSKPADPTKEGYTFGGWYSDEDCTAEFDFNTEITADTTIYAKWTPVSSTEPDPTPGGDEPAQPEKPKDKGCKSSISASLAIAGGMLALGTVAIVIKKKKTNK